MSEANRSVFLAALGDKAQNLHPAVYRYVAGPGEPGLVGIGDGVFDVAGSRFGRLNLLARPFVGPGLLMTAHERDVPFTVVNRPAPEDGPSGSLHAVRTFEFRRGAQSFIDVLQPGSTPGTLRNILGRARRVELELACGVTGEGHLSLSANGAWVRVGRLRIPLPSLLAVKVDVVDGYDDRTGRQTIRATVKNPLVGSLLEYRGSFTYRYDTATAMQ